MRSSHSVAHVLLPCFVLAGRLDVVEQASRCWRVRAVAFIAVEVNVHTKAFRGAPEGVREDEVGTGSESSSSVQRRRRLRRARRVVCADDPGQAADAAAAPFTQAERAPVRHDSDLWEPMRSMGGAS